jgi:dethiobiotin synthetase
VRFFVSGTGTGIGKTVITAALATAARAEGMRVHALKPVETGCTDGIAADACALAAAAGHPQHANHPGFHRGRLPLAPFAATLQGEAPPPPLSALVHAIDTSSVGADLVLIEGAGGLLVPYDEACTFADLALALHAPILLVLPNELGVLHAAAATIEAARSRRLSIAATILVDREHPDEASRTNAQILATKEPELPLLPFPWTLDPAQRQTAAKPILTTTGIT